MDKDAKDAAYENLLKAAQTIVRLSNEYNPDRNGYAIQLENIARAALPGNGS